MIDLTFNMSNGDCETIIDDDNMIQSCIRRLDTRLDSTLYDIYGSDLSDLLGLKKSDVNLQFINQSIMECLSQDERLSNVNVESEYTVDGLSASISIVYEDNVLDFDYETSDSDGEDIDG